jgi:hypothetical protein
VVHWRNLDVRDRTFYTQSANVIEVVAVDVCINTEQPTDDGPNCVSEVSWEGHT